MDYQQRMRVLIEQLNGFLRQYERPRSFDDEAALAEIRAIAEEMNSLLPSGLGIEAFNAAVTDALRSVRRSQTSRAWPTVAHFVAAARKSGQQAAASAPSAGEGLDTFNVNAGRIKRGEAVGEGWIYGTLAAQLLRRGLVTDDDLAPYRSGAFFMAKRVYGEVAALRMESTLKDRHRQAMAQS